jgi:hypothetical protein
MLRLAAFVVAMSVVVGLAEEEKSKLTPGQENMQQLKFLIGTWENESKKELPPMKIEWINNKSYIMLVAGYYREIYGWDLTDEEIVSWSFGTHGGQGMTSWTKDGDTWKGTPKAPLVNRWGTEFVRSRTMGIVDGGKLKTTWELREGDDWKVITDVANKVAPKKGKRAKGKEAKKADAAK